MAPKALRLLPLPVLLLSAVLAGCAGPSAPGEAAGPASPPQEEEAPPEPIVGRCEVTVNVGGGAPGTSRGAYLACPFEEAGDPEDYGMAVVEADFPGAPPTVTAVHLALETEECTADSLPEPCSHAHATSAGPRVRLDVAQGLLDRHAADGPTARAWLDGAAADQAIVVAITLVPRGHSLPPSYSAFG